MKKFQLLIIFILMPLGMLKADWQNYTGAESAANIAEIYIKDDKLLIQLEISFKDIKTFKSLVPQEWTDKKAIQRPPLEQRIEYFSQNVFKVLSDGKVLEPTLNLAEGRIRKERKSLNAGKMNPYTQQLIKGTPDDKEVLYCELEYSLKTKPSRLTFVPPVDKDGAIAATIGFVTYHNDVPVMDFRYLSRPSILNLDWKDPWFSKFNNKNLARHHKYPLMVYVYIEPRLIRAEALMRIEDMAAYAQFDLEGRDIKELQPHLETLFLKDDKLQIDGVHKLPHEVKVRYFKLGLKGLELLNDLEEKNNEAILLGVSQRYYIDTLPKKLNSKWNYFNKKSNTIPIVITDPAGPFFNFIYADIASYSWTNYLKKYSEASVEAIKIDTGVIWDIPYIGKKRVWKTKPSNEEAQHIISKALENIRIAYIEKEPASRSKSLASITDNYGESLEKEYSKLFAPAMQRGGFGEVDTFSDFVIKTLDYVKEDQSFRATISGYVKIKAMHWGHTEAMFVHYDLLIDMIEVKDQWLIKEFSVLDLREKK